MSPPAHCVNVAARLGYWLNTVTGTAWFDDLSLTGGNHSTRAGSHVVLVLENQDLLTVPEAAIRRWLGHLDQVYSTYEDLVGGTPYGGAPIRILSVRQYPGGWAVAGQPIQWMRAYVAPELMSVHVYDDWSFGVTHEISHDFDLDYRWVYHGESSANFKMYYAIETLGGQVMGGDDLRVGAQLKEFYRLKSEEGMSWDAITYRYILIRDAIGWEPFKQTYRFFTALPEASVPTTRQGKFDLFFAKLSDFSGRDVRAMFTAAEMAFITSDLK